MKKMTSKQKLIAGVLTASVVLSIGVVAITKSFDGGFENAPIEDVIAQKRELKLTLDYKSTPKESYIIGTDEITIITENITPAIDTTKLGTFTHTSKVDNENLDIQITIADSRTIEFADKLDFKVEAGIQKEDLEDMLTKSLIPETNIEDDKLDVQFTYPQDFDLNKESEYKDLVVVAKYANNGENRSTTKINVSVIAKEIIEPMEEDVVAEVEKPAEPTKPTEEVDKQPTPEKPVVKPAPEQPKEPAKPAPEKPSKPAPEKPKEEPKKPKEEPKKPAPEKPKEEPVQPKPEKPVETPEFKVPNGIPSGAVLVKSNPKEKFHKFNYGKNLSDGGKITEIATAWMYSEPQGNIYGIDKNGEGFSISYARDGGLSFKYWMPDIDQNSIDEINDIIESFFDAYGY